MTESSPGASLLALLHGGLRLQADQATLATLGDRRQYVGLSDVGRALECPRAALASKLYERPVPSLEKCLITQRGHWLEHGIGQALKARKLRILPQLEARMDYQGAPVKAHLDFTLIWQKPRPAVRILELKSTERLPETLYASYETQLYGQAGLLAHLWAQPAFSLRDENGTLLHDRLTMPDLCHAQFGLTLPKDPSHVDIEAWALCVSMSEAKPFGPYTPNEAMRDLCLRTAKNLWEKKLAVENGSMDFNTVGHAQGFHPLCASCDWNGDCPKFRDSEYQPEWQPGLDRLTKLKDSRSSLDSEIAEMETGLKDAYMLSGLKGGWINTGHNRFRLATSNGRRTLNRDRLRQELTDSLGIDNIDAFLGRCEQEGRAYSRLVINAIN